MSCRRMSSSRFFERLEECACSHNGGPRADPYCLQGGRFPDEFASDKVGWTAHSPRAEERSTLACDVQQTAGGVGCYDSVVRVLIVEDEPKSAAYLRKGLSEHGYIVDLAQN